MSKRPRLRRGAAPAVLAVAIAAGLGVLTGVGARAADPDALWKIVDQCVNRRSSDYCACAAFERSCCGAPQTPDADVVWAETADFVAIRDMTMCGCPAEFVAGLAMPRRRVSGVEDPRRPDAVWSFAWDVARRRIAQPEEIALVINPQNARTQNELHVHILRFREDARRTIEAATPGEGGRIPLPGLPETIELDLPDLDGVFSAAAKRVGAEHVGDSGILVAKRAAGGYRALLTSSYSPQAFTENRCTGEAPAH